MSLLGRDQQIFLNYFIFYLFIYFWAIYFFYLRESCNLKFSAPKCQEAKNQIHFFFFQFGNLNFVYKVMYCINMASLLELFIVGDILSITISPFSLLEIIF